MSGRPMSNERRTAAVGKTATFWVIAGLVWVLVASAAGAQSATDDPALVEAGEAVFSTNCAGCHGEDGTGTNTGRPLVGIADQEPDRLVHIQSVTAGKGGMPAFEADLSGEEIDAAVAYVRLTFVAERALDELPNTGMTSSLFLVAAGLVGTGLVLTGAARRRHRILG